MNQALFLACFRGLRSFAETAAQGLEIGTLFRDTRDVIRANLSKDKDAKLTV